MIQLDTLHSEGHCTREMYMLKLTPDSDWPVTPTQEPTKDKDGKTLWHQIRNPFMELDIFEWH